ncbi:unnamed protein product [Symbiodinium sp. CCMP2592]|nr:unnamed protein product [Symbiodinium sp. CCMP2592]
MARGDLVGRWRIVGAVRNKGRSYRDVVSSDFHRQFPDLFQASCVDLKSKLNSAYWFLYVSAQSEEPPCQEWLRRRELDHVVEEFPRETNLPGERFRFYRLADSMRKVTPGPTWKQAFHGTWMYGVWSTLAAGQLLASEDEGKGHEFWAAGIYCTPLLETAFSYARPQAMFADGSYCRAIFELMVDFDHLTAKRNKGGVQWVSKPEGVAVLGVWLLVNAPPSKGDEFMEAWDPLLEVRPENKTAVAAVVNERQMDWETGDSAWDTEITTDRAMDVETEIAKTQKGPRSLYAEFMPRIFLNPLRLLRATGSMEKRSKFVRLDGYELNRPVLRRREDLGNAVYSQWLKHVLTEDQWNRMFEGATSINEERAGDAVEVCLDRNAFLCHVSSGGGMTAELSEEVRNMAKSLASVMGSPAIVII